MARYIDADKLWNDRPQPTKNNDPRFTAGFNECMAGFSEIIRRMIDNPTDCVPLKSEVEKIFEEIRKRAYSERGFFVVNSDIDDFIAELKKKYTED